MPKEHTAGHLCVELKSFSDTLEEVLGLPNEKSEKELSRIRSKTKRALKRGCYYPGETDDTIARQTRVTATRADEHVRENPWTGVGIGTATGIVLGVLLSYR